MPETLHDLVERGRHRRESGQLLDQRVALGLRLAANDGIAVGVGRGPAHQVAVVVGEGLLELHREGVHQEGEDAVPRRQVDIEVVPLGGRDLGDPAFHQRLAGRDQLDDRRPPGIEVGLDGADKTEGHFMPVSRWPKNLCFVPSKADSAADLAFLLSVSSPWTMPVAFSASSMFWWITLKAPA